MRGNLAIAALLGSAFSTMAVFGCKMPAPEESRCPRYGRPDGSLDLEYRETGRERRRYLAGATIRGQPRFQELRRLPGDEVGLLEVRDCQFGDRELGSVCSALCNLTGLTLVNCPNIRGQFLEMLPHPEKLSGLLATGVGLDEAIARVLPRLPGLEALAMDDVAGAGRILRALPDMPFLKELEIRNATLTDDDLRCLNKFPNLDGLTLDNSKGFSGEGLQAVKLPKLTLLRANHSSLCTFGSPPPDAFPSLLALHLADSKVSDRDLESVSRLASVAELVLDGTPVSGVGLRALKRLPKLANLHLERTTIPESEFDALLGIETLWRVHLPSTVSQGFVDKWKARRPGIRILIEGNDNK